MHMLFNAFPQSAKQSTAERVELCRFTSSGTFNPADYPTLDGLYDVFMGGAGQGGGAADGYGVALGGSGGRIRLLRDIKIANSVQVAIGSGGNGSTSANSSPDRADIGNNGGNTIFGTYIAEGGGVDYIQDETDINVNPYTGISYGGAGGHVMANNQTFYTTSGIGLRAGRGIAVSNSNASNNQDLKATSAAGEGSGGGGVYIYNTTIKNINYGGKTGGGGAIMGSGPSYSAGNGGPGLVIIYGLRMETT